jgi:hypothetical protein
VLNKYRLWSSDNLKYWVHISVVHQSEALPNALRKSRPTAQSELVNPHSVTYLIPLLQTTLKQIVSRYHRSSHVTSTVTKTVKHRTLFCLLFPGCMQKKVAHDFRYDPRIITKVNLITQKQRTRKIMKPLLNFSIY